MDPIIDYRAGNTASLAMSRYMSRVYGWMTFGLMITAVTSYVLGNDPALMQSLMGSGLGMLVAVIVPFGLVMYLSFAINKMSVGAATFAFLLYSFTNALLLSTIFLRYPMVTIGQVFMVTAGSFAGLALYGTVTKRDLTAMGAFFGMALWGLIIGFIVNMFMKSTGLDLALSYAGVLIFAGLTAYDTQRIKALAARGDFESDAAHKAAIMGALILYLDFINLFLSLLRVMGGRRRD